MSNTPSVERSQAQADIIVLIRQLLVSLDTEYLRNALKEFENKASFLASAMILNPDQATAIQQQNVRESQNKVMRKLVELAEAEQEAQECRNDLQAAQENADTLSNLFR